MKKRERGIKGSRDRGAAAGIGFLLVMVVCVQAEGPDPHQLVEQGNLAFADGKFDEALSAYREAEVSLPASAELAYNLGAAHFKLNDYSAARDAFNRALLTRDLGLEAKAKYNLGDVAYISALDKQSEPSEALDLAKTAMGHYRDAIELNAEDEDARQNIEIAQLFIKDMMDKLKQQQEQQQDQQKGDEDQENENKEDQQEQQQEGEQDDSEGEQEQQQQGDQEQPADQEQQQQQPQDGGEGEEGEAQQQPQDVQEMTSEEAEKLLQAVRDKERQRREDQQRRMRARRVPVLKDW